MVRLPPVTVRLFEPSSEKMISGSFNEPLAALRLALVMDEPLSYLTINVEPYMSRPMPALNGMPALPAMVTVFPSVALLSI